MKRTAHEGRPASVIKIVIQRLAWVNAHAAELFFCTVIGERFAPKLTNPDSSVVAGGIFSMVAIAAVMVVRVVSYSPAACKPRVWVVMGTHC